jgi:ankyrin repeat protein
MKGMTLHQACKTGLLDVLPDLLSLGYDVNQLDENGRPPILVAALCGHWEVVNLLLQEPNIKMDDESVLVMPNKDNLLHLAAQTTDQKQFYKLLTHPKLKGTVSFFSFSFLLRGCLFSQSKKRYSPS